LRDQNAEWSSSQLRRATKAAGVALWTWNVDTDAFLMDRRGYELWGVKGDSVLRFEHLSAITSGDRDLVRAAFSAARAVSVPTKSTFEY
jgi:PAS domain-containing protein